MNNQINPVRSSLVLGSTTCRGNSIDYYRNTAMGKFLFWGPLESLKKLADLSQQPPQWLEVVKDEASAQAVLDKATGPKLLFVTEEVLRTKSDVLLRLKSSDSELDIVYINAQENTQTKIQWLKNVSSVNHLLPIHSNITKNLFKRVLEDDWRKIFVQSPEKIFFPENLGNLIEMKLHHVDECTQAYDKISDYLEDSTCFDGFNEMMITAASELLTNAFYNGPRDTQGKALVADRKVKFALPNHHFIKFSFGKVDEYFWMSVSDNFGTLDRNTLINAMNRAATERTAKIEGVGGAGLGLIMLFEWASEIGFQLTEGISTTVACRFKMVRRQKEFDAEPSVFHVFTNNP